MSKNVDHIQHVKSNVVIDNEGVLSPKLPNPSALVEGEIAVNYAKGYETLSIKNASGDVVPFSSDEYYTEKKLGSGFTGVNSAKTVTDAINESIFVPEIYYKKSETSGATELTTAFNGKSDTGHTHDDRYYTETEIDTKLGTGFTVSSVTDVIESNERATSQSLNELNTNKTDVSAFTAHTASTVHMNTSEKENLDSLATNISTISGITPTKVTNWDGAATNSHTHSNKTALDSITGNVGTMAYENANSYSSATEVNTALEGKANTATTIAGYGITDAKIENQVITLGSNNITVSSATEVNTALNGKSDTGHTHSSNEVTSMSGYSMAASGTSITTGDTLNQAIGKLEKRFDGVSIVKISQTDYDNLNPKDSNTLYIITED